MKIVLMRHGEASYSAGRSDKERPLTTYGTDQARRAGEWLHDRNLCPDIVFCSSALRTRQTWLALSKSPPIDVEARILDELYLANANELLTALHQSPVDASCVLMIAHNPGLSALASSLANRRIGMGTSHMVVFDQTNNPPRFVDHFIA